MTATLPKRVADIKARISELSEQDRLLLDEVLHVERKNDEWAALPWPWELLDHRKQALERGESQVIPLEEVAERLRARRVAKP